MKLPKQFALSTLLLAMLFASLAFGLPAWRANKLRAEVAAINREGVTRVELGDSWLWPTVSEKTSLVFKQDFYGNLYIGDKPATSAAVGEKYEEMKRRLAAIGVKEVGAIIRGEVLYRGEAAPDIHIFVSDDDFYRRLQWRSNAVPEFPASEGRAVSQP